MLVGELIRHLLLCLYRLDILFQLVRCYYVSVSVLHCCPCIARQK